MIYLRPVFGVLFFCSVLFSACSDNGENKSQELNGEQDLFAYNLMEPYFDQNWAMHKLWDDGLAEVAIYDAERVVYNKNRQFDFTMITVKEDFNKEFNVKSDNYKRQDIFPVIKVNQFYRLETEKYPYHYLTSIFIKRQNPYTLHKLTTSSQEWCGNTFKSFTDEKKYFEFEYDSYFDNQGEGKKQVQKDVLFEDQLLYSLRSLKFKENLAFEASVLETQQTNKATEPIVYQTTISVRSDTLNNSNAWQVTVKLDKTKTNQYWFAVQYPNHLLKRTTWDGRNLTLKDLHRDAYWKHE